MVRTTGTGLTLYIFHFFSAIFWESSPKKQKQVCTDYNVFEQSDREIEKSFDSDAGNVIDADLFSNAMTTKAEDKNVEGGETEMKDAVPIEEFTPNKRVFKKNAYIVTIHCMFLRVCSFFFFFFFFFFFCMLGSTHLCQS